MDAARIAEMGIRELPGTLGEALDELEADEVIRDALGRPRVPPLHGRQAGRMGRVPDAGLGLGGGPLPGTVLRGAASARP